MLLKWQADFLLATNAILECSERICVNYGTCLNFDGLATTKAIDEICVCADGFFGPNCEYTDDDLVMSVLSHGTLSIGDYGNKSRRSSYSVDAGIHENQTEYETRDDNVEDSSRKNKRMRRSQIQSRLIRN